MKERYYIIDPEAPICKDYIAYRKNVVELNKIMRKFAEEEGIESYEYWASEKALAIVPTKNDLVKFWSQLRKDELNGGLRMFKKNSEVGKKWAMAVVKFEIKIRPAIWMYYHDLLGKMRTRLFEIDGVFYCSIESEYEYIKPNDFCEMKASEFFKVIEDYEERMKK